VNGITLDQVKTAWQRHVQPDKLITVIVGGGQPPKRLRAIHRGRPDHEPA
jgi:predicted Zn-dependent peptidase